MLFCCPLRVNKKRLWMGQLEQVSLLWLVGNKIQDYKLSQNWGVRERVVVSERRCTLNANGEEEEKITEYPFLLLSFTNILLFI